MSNIAFTNEVSTIALGNTTLSDNSVYSGIVSPAGNGYSSTLNGLLLQWGSLEVSNTTVAVSFPQTFPNTCFQVVVSSNDAYQTVGAYGVSASGFTVFGTNTALGFLASWLAIGM